MNSTQPPLSASSIAKMKLMAADHELSEALVKVIVLLAYCILLLGDIIILVENRINITY